MKSHHFLGLGRLSETVRCLAREPEDLFRRVADLVETCGLRVVGDRLTRFDNDGLTLVWVLAESHLVLHYWGSEGFASIDLHVCDYRGSNRTKARRLVEGLTELCLAPNTDVWRELRLDMSALTTASTPRV